MINYRLVDVDLSEVRDLDSLVEDLGSLEATLAMAEEAIEEHQRAEAFSLYARALWELRSVGVRDAGSVEAAMVAVFDCKSRGVDLLWRYEAVRDEVDKAILAAHMAD